jgi:iron complex outermembrane receptor protein
MIERIEVLQDGASAIYGSDAIAGVVNIITRKEQDGLRASAQLGVYGEGDGFTQNYQLSWGTGWSGTQPRRRRQLREAGRDQLGRPRHLALPDARHDRLRRLVQLGHAERPLHRARQDLTLRAPVIGRAPTLADFRPSPAPDRFNFAPFNFIQTPLERYGAFVNFTQELGETPISR